MHSCIEAEIPTLYRNMTIGAVVMKTAMTSKTIWTSVAQCTYPHTHVTIHNIHSAPKIPPYFDTTRKHTNSRIKSLFFSLLLNIMCENVRNSLTEMGQRSDCTIRPKSNIWPSSPNAYQIFSQTSVKGGLC